jgi:hypothetical protein
MLRLGYLSGPRPLGMDCERPVRWGVSDVGEPYRVEIFRCGDKREKRCRPCSARYRRRVQSVASEGMFNPQGNLGQLTLTAPSQLGQHCMRPGCSATSCGHVKCLCTPPEGVDLSEWNGTCGKRWSHLLRLLTHYYGVRPSYFRAVEVQDGKRTALGVGRGALHLHVVVRFDHAVSLKTLRALAMRAGFGHEIDWQPIDPGSAHATKVAWYVSKYVTKATGAREDVPWSVATTDPETAEVTVSHHATYRTWSQSVTWGRTMAEIRAADLARYRVQEQLRALHEPRGLSLDPSPTSRTPFGQSPRASDHLHPAHRAQPVQCEVPQPPSPAGHGDFVLYGMGSVCP